MSADLMLLPSSNFANICLVRIPEDFEEHEAYRYATGVIANVEEQGTHCSREDVRDALEERGFETVAFLLGPELA